MGAEHLEKIIKLDQMVFHREEPRSLQNLQGLRRGDEDGCFVLMDGRELVGYSFSKTMGDEGYLGPLGLHPPKHGQGLGQRLIEHSQDYLRKHCGVIGLEVRPESGKNIGLYHKLGFHPTNPSFIINIPESISFPEKHSPMVDNLDFEFCQELSGQKREIISKKIDIWSRRELRGVSFQKDIDLAVENGGKLIVTKEGNEPVGFLIFYPEVFLHLWGAVKPHIHQNQIIIEMIRLFRAVHGSGEISMAVNSRYQYLVDLLLKHNFKIEKSVVRMLMEDFEGEHLKKSSNMIIRAWHA